METQERCAVKGAADVAVLNPHNPPPSPWSPQNEVKSDPARNTVVRRPAVPVVAAGVPRHGVTPAGGQTGLISGMGVAGRTTSTRSTGGTHTLLCALRKQQQQKADALQTTVLLQTTLALLAPRRAERG